MSTIDRPQLRLVPPINDKGALDMPVCFEPKDLPPGEPAWKQLVQDFSEIVEKSPTAYTFSIGRYVDPRDLTVDTYAVGDARWPDDVQLNYRERQSVPQGFWQRLAGKKPEVHPAAYKVGLGLEGACFTALLVYFSKQLPEQYSSESEPALNMWTSVKFSTEAQVPESGMLTDIQNSGSDTFIFPQEGFVRRLSPTEITISSVDKRITTIMTRTAFFAQQLGIEGADGAIEQIFGGTASEVREAIDSVKDEVSPLKAATTVRDRLPLSSPPPATPTLRSIT